MGGCYPEYRIKRVGEGAYLYILSFCPLRPSMELRRMVLRPQAQGFGIMVTDISRS